MALTKVDGSLITGTLDVTTPASSYANSAFSKANTADQRAVTSGSYANSAYGAANTADQRAVTSGSYANSAFSIANNRVSSVSASSGLSSSGGLTPSITMDNTGVTATTYGSSSQVPVIAVNSRGQITSASNASLASPTILLQGEYSVGTTYSVGVSGTRPIQVTFSTSSVQGGPATIQTRFYWGIGSLTDSYATGAWGVNFVIVSDPGCVAFVTPSGAGTLYFRVETDGLSNDAYRFTAIQL
jgi:hypothetical protein